MTMQRYRTRSVPVLAVQYDGTNLQDLKDVGVAQLSDQLQVGSWLVIDPENGRWQVLPNKVFERVYIRDQAGPSVYRAAPQEWPRICFNCINYSASNDGISYCTLFKDRINDELLEAADCSAYEQWRP